MGYNPFQLHSDPSKPKYAVRNLTLPGGVTLERLDDRERLLSGFDTLRRDIDSSGSLDAADRFQHQAIDLISGPLARQAFDISREAPRLRDRYGRNTWGQSCLLARRLVEAGVTLVTVRMDGWDDHGRSHPQLRSKLPRFDQAIAALVTDVADRGLSDRVAICMFGEFGRTPRINAKAGRDHWAQAGFCVFAGGGLKTGLVVGETTAKAEFPKDRPVSPEDILATLYHVLGINPNRTFTNHAGRPIPILAKGAPIAELI